MYILMHFGYHNQDRINQKAGARGLREKEACEGPIRGKKLKMKP